MKWRGMRFAAFHVLALLFTLLSSSSSALAQADEDKPDWEVGDKVLARNPSFEWHSGTIEKKRGWNYVIDFDDPSVARDPLEINADNIKPFPGGPIRKSRRAKNEEGQRELLRKKYEAGSLITGYELGVKLLATDKEDAIRVLWDCASKGEPNARALVVSKKLAPPLAWLDKLKQAAAGNSEAANRLADVLDLSGDPAEAASTLAKATHLGGGVDSDKLRDLIFQRHSPFTLIMADGKEKPRTSFLTWDYERVTISSPDGKIISIPWDSVDEKLLVALKFTRGEREALDRTWKLAKEKESAYKIIPKLIAGGNFDEAIQIYRRYADVENERNTFGMKASALEKIGRYEEAIAVYRDLGNFSASKRLAAVIEEKARLMGSARSSENAGNHLEALLIYRRCGEKEGERRCAEALAKGAEENQKYGAAAKYYEIAGLYDDARRVRAAYKVSPDDPQSMEIQKIVSKAGTQIGGSLTPEQVFEVCAPAVVTIIAGRSSGTGFFVRDGGMLLTNSHVVSEAVERGYAIHVRTQNKKEFPAHVLASSGTPDLALLKVDCENHAVLDLGDSDEVKPGCNVCTIGSPGSMNGQILEQSIASGVVSNRRIFKGNKTFQITVPLNHGNSGGPLLDIYGKVIGVTTFSENTLAIIDGEGVGSDKQGLNYAIQINEAAGLIKKAEGGQ